jgi:hypothetical protein
MSNEENLGAVQRRAENDPLSKASFDDQRYVALALGAARDGLVEFKGSHPSGPEIVFEALAQAVDVHRRWKVKNGPAGSRTSWPDYVRSFDERKEAGIQRVKEWLDGILTDQSPPTPKQLSTMDAVYRIFRSCMVDKEERQLRDWGMMLALATPSGSLRKVGDSVGRSHVHVKDRKDLQCAAIWKRTKHLLPSSTPFMAQAA